MESSIVELAKMIDPVEYLDIPVDDPAGITYPIYPYPETPPIIKEETIFADEPAQPFRSFHYYGFVTDAADGKPIPGASVVLYANGQNLGGQAAGNDGSFDIYSNQEAESITVTSTGYQGKNFPATLIKHDFPLEKKETELPPVIVTAPKKKDSNLLWWGVIAFLAYKAFKR